MKHGFDNFINAARIAQDSLINLRGAAYDLERMNWELEIGIDFDREEYQHSIDNFISSAQKYVTDHHFEITMATRLIMGEDYDMTGLNNTFERIQGELDSLGEQLQAKFKVEIDAELDTEGILELQNQITELMNKMARAEQRASLDTIRIRFGGENLLDKDGMIDEESFNRLLQELEKNAETAKEGFANAFNEASLRTALAI
jgi:hypothetical protein